MSISYHNLDWKLIFCAGALTLIGILLIYSAHYYSSSEFQQDYFLRQATWFAVALIAFLFALHLPLRLFDATAYLLYGISLALLVAVLMFGTTRLGATRWFDFGPVSFAPADLAKIATLLALSRFFAYSRRKATSSRNMVLAIIMAAAPAALVLKQPDLGTTMIFLALFLGLWFWSGVSLARVTLTLSPAVAILASLHPVALALYFATILGLVIYFRPRLIVASALITVNLVCGIVTPFLWSGLHEYQQRRILTFLDPGQDPRGAGYQVIQSRISVGSGGFTGKGFLNSTQSRLEYLPERHTDFVFSTLGEEFGFIGAIIALGLFGFVLFRMVRIAARCRSKFSAMIVFGTATIILFQMFVNVGMAIGITPVTGLPLPFVSYGGTSLVFFWFLMGLVISAENTWQEY